METVTYFAYVTLRQAWMSSLQFEESDIMQMGPEEPDLIRHCCCYWSLH